MLLLVYLPLLLLLLLLFLLFLLQEVSELIVKEAKRMQKAHSPVQFINYTRLQQLLKEAGLMDTMDQVEVDQAVQFLHECGTMLHYNDLLSNLSHMYFINPEWLCGMMSRIISIRELTFIQKGVSE